MGCLQVSENTAELGGCVVRSALLDPVLRAKTERRDSAEEAHTDAQPSPASASAQALLDAMPSKPPKDMVPLGLPHPSASVHLCPQLW